MKGKNTYGDIVNEKFNELMSADMHDSWQQMRDLLDKEMPEKEKKKRFGIPFIIWRKSEMWLVAALMTGLIYFIATRLNKIPEESVRAHERLYGAGSSKHPVNKAKDTSGEGTVVSSRQESAVPVKKAEEVQKKEVEQEIQQETAPVNYSTAKELLSAEVVSTDVSASSQSVEENHTSKLFSHVTTASVKKQTTTPKETISITQSTTENVQPVLNIQAVLTNELTSEEELHKGIHPKDIAWNRPADNSSPAKPKPSILKTKGFVIGASINYNMPLSDQEMSTVAVSGKKNILVDFLPSLYVQYHFDKKWYVEGGFQFSSPQYTPSVKLYSDKDYLSSVKCEEKAIWLNKLYYMNVPLIINYKPLPGLSVGVGAQYSRLHRSVFMEEFATWERSVSTDPWEKMSSEKEVKVKAKEDRAANGSRGNPPTNPGTPVSNMPTQAQSDTAIQNIKVSDWRGLVNISYTWKRFIVGARYTAGFDNYINTQSTTNYHIQKVKDRNQALQIYLGINIFDRRKPR